MDLSLDRASEIPLGTQLMWKLRTAIATGAIHSGARLPGIRDLAEAAGVNVNTVRSVVARLEEQGLLVSEQGRGTFVSCDVYPDATLIAARDTAIAWARGAGIDPQALAAALFIGERDEQPVKADSERAQRRLLHGEIATLEQQLAQLDPLGSLDVRAEQAAPRLLSATELRAVRDRLDARIRDLRRERDDYRAEQLAPEQPDGDTQPVPRSRWRHAGVWTAHPAAQVSWTSP